MLRDFDTDRPQTLDETSVWPVLSRTSRTPAHAPAPAAEIAEQRPAFHSAPSAPDVPAAVGGLMFAAYAALIGALALATAGPGQSIMMLVIAGLFVVAFFTVPRLILAQEPKDGKRPSLDRFLATGLPTYTGQCSGAAALVQMLIVPICLTFGVLGMAVISAFVF